MIACHQAATDYVYSPDVASGETTAGETIRKNVRTFVTVRGFEMSKDEAGRSARIRFRVRVENVGSAKIRVQPNSFRLISRELKAFGSPSVKAEKQKGWSLPTDDSLRVTVSFPVPAKTLENRAMDWLELSWTIESGGRTYPFSATFERVKPERGRDYYYCRYHHRYHYYGAFGFHHSRHHFGGHHRFHGPLDH